MRRLAAAALMVWGCSCGAQGHVPAWVATRAAAAALTPSTQLCKTWALVWNHQAKLHSNTLRVIGGMGRPDGEALAVCVWLVEELHRPGHACYRGLIDTSLRTWRRPVMVDCQHPWAHHVAMKPVA